MSPPSLPKLQESPVYFQVNVTIYKSWYNPCLFSFCVWRNIRYCENLRQIAKILTNYLKKKLATAPTLLRDRRAHRFLLLYLTNFNLRKNDLIHCIYLFRDASLHTVRISPYIYVSIPRSFLWCPTFEPRKYYQNSISNRRRVNDFKSIGNLQRCRIWPLTSIIYFRKFIACSILRR